MAVHSLFPREEADLQVVTVSPGHWAVRARPSWDAEANPMLGHIDAYQGRYEVLELADPLVFAAYPTLELAIEHFVVPAILDGSAPVLSPARLRRAHRFTA